MKVIYTGWPSLKLAPDLTVEDDERNQYYGWLFAKHPDGQWVTLADLKPLGLRSTETIRALSPDAGGKVLVPREPTPKMVVAGWQCAGSVSKALDCYRAMLAAAGAKNYE